ncbi:hypothetical protein [Sporosarcina phage Lietuvens]|nr:hypothetical protein [Sporosarcina phage Lietuvens]
MTNKQPQPHVTLTQSQAQAVELYRAARTGYTSVTMTQAHLDALVSIEPSTLTQALGWGYDVVGDKTEGGGGVA